MASSHAVAEGDKWIYQVTFYVTDGWSPIRVTTSLSETLLSLPRQDYHRAPTTVFVDEIYEYRPMFRV
jgi:hypothetical protein